MTRILVLGAAPLPFEQLERQYAANLRTWHFTRPLLDDGHHVRLIGYRLPKTYPEDVEPMLLTRRGRLEYYSLTDELYHDSSYIQNLADEFDPQAILGVNTHPSSRAVLIATDRPIWCDLNGWIMAEAQTKCHVYDDDRYLSHFWNMEREVLDRADVISAVSEAQVYATIGELAVRGRLGRKSFGYRFVHRIPNAISEVEYRHDKKVFRGSAVGERDFVVLWAGGYNTWTDVGLLYDALAAAMEEVPDLRFVSTGGAIDGHDEITFESFRKRAGASDFSNRFHFAGWVPTEDVPSYYFESDLGINVDSYNYETIFGARNRLNEWMKVGLPVLTTTGTEISRIVAERGLGLTAETGDSASFAERMIWAARHPQELRAMADAARTFVEDEFSYERTTEPLRAWAANPRRAPDEGRRAELSPFDLFARGDSGSAPDEPEPSESEPEAVWQPPDDEDLPAIERDRVCAVIVHHRGEAMLARCLESLLASAAVELDVVVVENACSEALPEIARTSPLVHTVVSETSLGFSHANNLGVEWARKHLGEPDFFYFVNNDTESSRGALARQIAALEARPEAAMAGPTLLILDADDHYNSLGVNVTEDGWGWDEAIGLAIADYGPPPASRPVLTVTGSALLIDAPVFREIGGWTEVYEYYFEDIDLGIKVWKARREVIHVPDAVVRHQISATMTEGSERKTFLFWRNRLMLALVHWPLGLLMRTFRRAIFAELLNPEHDNRPMLRRALTEALGRLPALLRCRWRWRGDTSWRRFLVPPGSVPVISLPESGGEAEARAVEAEDAESLEPALKTPPPGPGPADALAAARAELEAQRERAERAEAEGADARRALQLIHTSKMWRLWMAYIGTRRWLLRPFSQK